MKKLGASQAFDYKSPTIVPDLIAAFKGKILAGALAIGAAAAGQNTLDKGPAISCIEVVSKSNGNKFVACAMPPPDNLPEGVGAKFCSAGSIRDDEVGGVVYVDFLPKALAEGSFVAEDLPAALEAQKKGVSAKKIVVSL